MSNARAWFLFIVVASLPGAGLHGVRAAMETPLDRVVLFKSGVAYYEHAAELDGAEALQFRFREEQLNDVVKSLVVGDPESALTSARFRSREPLDRLLDSYRVDLSGAPSIPELLERMRGEEVRILQAGRAMEGRILGVETRERGAGDQVVEIFIVNLAREGGALTQIPLEGIETMRWRDSEIQADWQRALDAVAQGRSREHKTLSISFAEAGPRTVRVGYLLEAPLWKSSYRLILGEDQNSMLAWAHIENATEQDWQDVRLQLVSGRPVSFAMNMVEPLYVDRPVVELDVHGLKVPDKYEGARTRSRPAAPQMELKAEAAPLTMKGLFAGRSGGGRESSLRESAADRMVPAEDAGMEGGEAGELFAFSAPRPLSLGRSEAAMIPLFHRSVEAEPLSLFDVRQHGNRPFNAVVLSNTTDTPWMNGPVTVYEAGQFAGDARLPLMPGGADRLVPYALDLETEVDHTSEQPAEEVVEASIRRGVLMVERRRRRVTHYSLRSERPEPRPAMVVHPRAAGWTLETPEPSETTAGEARFRLTLAPGEATDLDVTETRLISRRLRLSDLGLDTLEVYMRNRDLPADVRRALETVSRLRQAIAEQERAVERMETDIREIITDQDRIRQNMQAVNRNSQSFREWESKLVEQEEQLEQLRKKLEQARDGLAESRETLERTILNLNT